MPTKEVLRQRTRPKWYPYTIFYSIILATNTITLAVQPHRDAIGAKQLTMNQKSEPNRNNSEEKKNEKERDTVITVTQNGKSGILHS